MEKYSPTQILEWSSRPMTQEENTALWVHLDHLYNIVREAELTFSQVKLRMSIYEQILEDMGKHEK